MLSILMYNVIQYNVANNPMQLYWNKRADSLTKLLWLLQKTMVLQETVFCCFQSIVEQDIQAVLLFFNDETCQTLEPNKKKFVKTADGSDSFVGIHCSR